MGNILSGLDLLRRTSDSPVSCYGMCFPLLTNAEGAKMGKSVGGAIWLSSGLYSIRLLILTLCIFILNASASKSMLLLYGVINPLIHVFLL